MKLRGARGGPAPILLALTILWALTLAGCDQATSDPDAEVKALVTSTTWATDHTNYPDDTEVVITFRADGSAYYGAALHAGVWSYQSGVFTVTTSLGTFTTTNPTIGSGQFNFNYASGPCHLVPYSG